MGGCMSVCDKLFSKGAKREDTHQNSQELTYIDADFNKLSKPTYYQIGLKSYDHVVKGREKKKKKENQNEEEEEKKMGRCMSFYNKLFKKVSKKDNLKNHQESTYFEESTYLDSNFNKLNKPLLLGADRKSDDYAGIGRGRREQQQNEEGEERRMRINEGNDSDSRSNGKNNKKESISIEMQERRLMVERQRELDEIEQEDILYANKMQNINSSLYKIKGTQSATTKQQLSMIDTSNNNNNNNKSNTINNNKSNTVNNNKNKTINNNNNKNNNNNNSNNQNNSEKLCSQQQEIEQESILSQKQLSHNDGHVNLTLQPKLHQAEQSKHIVPQPDNKYTATANQNKVQIQNTGVGIAFSSLSTQEQGELRGEDDEAEIKKSNNVCQVLRLSQRRKEIDQNNGNNIMPNKESKFGHNQKSFTNDNEDEDELNNDTQVEFDEYRNENWKHIDKSKQCYLQSDKLDDSTNLKNGEFNGDVSAEIETREEEDEDDQEKEDSRIKEEKIQQIRKSLQSMNFKKNFSSHKQGGNMHQQPSHTQGNSQSQHGISHAVSVPSLINQDGLSKISSIPLPQAQSVSQNLNQNCDEIDLSLLISDSQKNSIFYTNFPYIVKDSKFFLDESIIHPVKNPNGAVTSMVGQGEGVDSDSSSKREDEWIGQMRKQQSTHDLINLLQQTCSQNQQNNNNNNNNNQNNNNNNIFNQNNNQISNSNYQTTNINQMGVTQPSEQFQIQKKNMKKSDSTEGKLLKSKEDLGEVERDRQQFDSFEHFKNTLINQIVQQQKQGGISSTSSIGATLSKKEYQQNSEEIISSRQGSQNNIQKASNKNTAIERNKSLSISEDNLVTIKEEESARICEGSSSLNQPDQKGEQHEFSFCVDQLNQSKLEDDNLNSQHTQVQTAVILQKSEISFSKNNEEEINSNQNIKKEENRANSNSNTQQILPHQQESFSKDAQNPINNASQNTEKQQNTQQDNVQSMKDQQSQFSSRYSLRQPQQQNKQFNRSDSGNISIVVQDPRNNMTEQLIFTIHPLNSKVQLNQSASSQRDSVISTNNNNADKRDSILNRTQPHRSLLENTNRVIMQKRTSRKSLHQSQSSQQLSQQNPQQQQQQLSQQNPQQQQNVPSIFQQNTETRKDNSQILNGATQQQTNQVNQNEMGDNFKTYIYEGAYSANGQNNSNQTNVEKSKACSNIPEFPQNAEFDDDDEEDEGEDSFNEKIDQNKREKRRRRKPTPIVINNSLLQKSQSHLEQSTLMFEEELKKMQQDKQKLEGNEESNEHVMQIISEINSSSKMPQLQMSNSNGNMIGNNFNMIGNGITHSESYNNFTTISQQQSDEAGETTPTSSPNLKHISSSNSQRASYRFYSVQSIPPNQQNSQKQAQNSGSIEDTPFYTCFNTPQASKRESQNWEPKIISQQDLLQRKSGINESRQVSYYRKNSAMMYHDCDSYQVQAISSDQLQNKDLLEQPELFMQWVDTLNQNTPEVLSSEAIYQFEIIKQETYQDFLYKFEQEYHYNLELFDGIIQTDNEQIYFRSELGLDQERLFVITGEYYVNTPSYAAFYNFKNNSNVQSILNAFDCIYALNDDLQNTVLYANCTAKQLSKPCEFVFLKHFSFLQQNAEVYADSDGQSFQPIEQMCEIDISLNSEEIEQFVKKNKKNSNRGEVFSGNITTFLPESNQLRVEIMIEHNFHNMLTSQQAKSMYTEMFTNYFKKLNSVFP